MVHPALEKFVSSLVDFEKKYPILFECLYAVLGATVSNSRLCEQIHGMMRYVLNPAIGMDQADHHHQYTTHTAYGMCEARRILIDGSGKGQNKKKKAVKHSKQSHRRLC